MSNPDYKRRRWTKREDSALRFAAALGSRDDTGGRPRKGKIGALRDMARELDRSYAAVLQRAHRIGARVRANRAKAASEP